MTSEALLDAWRRLIERPASRHRLEAFEQWSMLEASGMKPTARWVSRWRDPGVEHGGLRISHHVREPALLGDVGDSMALVVVGLVDGIGVWDSRSDGAIDYLLVSPASARLGPATFAVAPARRDRPVRLATSQETDGVRLWDLDRLLPIGQVDRGDTQVRAVIPSLGGDWVASGDGGGGYEVYSGVTIWRHGSGKLRPVHHLDCHQHDLVIWDVRMSVGDDAELLVLLCGPAGAALWRPVGDVVRRLPGSSGRLGRLLDGRDVVATVTESDRYAERSGLVHVSDVYETGARVVELPHQRGVAGLDFVHFDGDVLLAVATVDGRVALWDPGTGEAVDDFETGCSPRVIVGIPGPEDRPFSLGVGGADGTIVCWGHAGSRQLRLEGEISGLAASAATAGGLLLAEEVLGRTHDEPRGLTLFSLEALLHCDGGVKATSVAAVPAMDALAVIDQAGGLDFRWASTGKRRVARETDHELGPGSGVFAVVGTSRVAFASTDPTMIALWSADGQRLRGFRHGGRAVEAVVTMQDGDVGILWKSEAGVVELWRPSTDAKGPRFPGRFATVSADGILATEVDDHVRLFDLELGAELGDPLPGTAPALGAFDGHRAVARYHDGAVKVTRVDDGNPVVRPTRNVGDVRWIALDNDATGRPFVSVGSDRRLAVLGRLPTGDDDRLRCVGGAVVGTMPSSYLSLGPSESESLRFIVHGTGWLEVLDVALGHEPLSAQRLSPFVPPSHQRPKQDQSSGTDRPRRPGGGATIGAAVSNQLVVGCPVGWLAQEGVPGFHIGPARFAITFRLRTPLIRVPDQEHCLDHVSDNVYLFRGRLRSGDGPGLVLDAGVPLVNSEYDLVGAMRGTFEAEVSLHLGEDTLIHADEQRSWNIEEIREDGHFVCAPNTG